MGVECKPFVGMVVIDADAAEIDVVVSVVTLGEVVVIQRANYGQNQRE